MGWTYTRMQDHKSLSQIKQDHEWDATRYGSGIKAELLASEWKAKAWFAIIRLSYPADHDRHPGQVKTWLRIDLIDTSAGQFGYKDGAEEMGMYQEGRPSPEFKKKIYDLIPNAESYAKEWRDRNGVKYRNSHQMELIA